MTASLQKVVIQSKLNQVLNLRKLLIDCQLTINDYLLFNRADGEIDVIEDMASQAIEVINLFLKYDFNCLELADAITKTINRLNDIGMWNYQKVFIKASMLLEMLIDTVDCYFDNLVDLASKYYFF